MTKTTHIGENETSKLNEKGEVPEGETTKTDEKVDDPKDEASENGPVLKSETSKNCSQQLVAAAEENKVYESTDGSKQEMKVEEEDDAWSQGDIRDLQEAEEEEVKVFRCFVVRLIGLA